VLQCRALASIAAHFFTTRQFAFESGGDESRWSALRDAIGGDALVRLRQVHGCTVVVAGPATAALPQPEADALVCATGGPALAVQVADCVPILIGSRGGPVAAVHAGWRGTAAGIAGAAVEALGRLGAGPEDLVVAIGPAIGPCCYEVHWDLRRGFLEKGWSDTQVGRWFVDRGDARPLLDLWSANREQLEAAGVPPAQVHVSALCTATHRETFYSYRADGPGTGRMVGVIRGLCP
jgi:YfiH family protein